MVLAVAVVGAGWWSSLAHLPALAGNQDAVIAAVVDPNPDKLAWAAQTYGATELYPDVASLLASRSVDAAVVAVPHAHHYEAARALLAAGAHVLVDKPFTIRSADAWELVALAEKSGRHLMVGYTWQFTSHAAAARELVQGGDIGELVSVSGLFASMADAFYRGSPEEYDALGAFPAARPDPRTYSDPAVSGGGQGQTQATHAVGMLCWVTRRRPVAVCAYMNTMGLRVDVADAIAFELEGGAVGTLASSGTLRAGQPHLLELRYMGSDGFVYQDPQNGTLCAGRNGQEPRQFDRLPPDERYPAHAPVNRLVDLALGRSDFNPAPGSEAAMAVELIEGAYRSVQAAVAGASEGDHAST